MGRNQADRAVGEVWPRDVRQKIRDVFEVIAELPGQVRAGVEGVHLVDPDVLQHGCGLLDLVEQCGRLAVGERHDQLGAGSDVFEDVAGLLARFHGFDAIPGGGGRIRSPVVSDTDFVPAGSIPVRPAATVMLVRDGADGLEVFMLRRTLSAAFARGQYVFPGGKVDDADHGEAFEPICDGLDDATASAQMGIDHGGLAWLVAAIRECFEEAGVLLARPADADHIVRFDGEGVEQRFNDARHRIHDGSLSLVDLCAAERLLLLTDRIHLVDHWITPVGERRRFDTRFFVALAPEAQEPLHDDNETIASLWVRPADAIRMWKDGELQMFPPTVVSLQFLEPHATAAEAVAAAAAVGVPPVIVPRIVVEDGRIVGVRRPGDPDYENTQEPEFVLSIPR